MRNLVLLAHVSLDGYLAGPGGDMSFVTMNAEIGEFIYPLIRPVDTAVYGRTTFQLMEGYWPTDQAEWGPLEREHARWYLGVDKVVASRTLPASRDPKVRVVADDIVGELAALKRRPGGDIMIFASPTLVHTLAEHDLIDDWRLNLQPVILGGGGLPLFVPSARRAQLELRASHTFACGVIATHYRTRRG